MKNILSILIIILLAGCNNSPKIANNNNQFPNRNISAMCNEFLTNCYSDKFRSLNDDVTVEDVFRGYGKNANTLQLAAEDEVIDRVSHGLPGSMTIDSIDYAFDKPIKAGSKDIKQTVLKGLHFYINSSTNKASDVADSIKQRLVTIYHTNDDATGTPFEQNGKIDKTFGSFDGNSYDYIFSSYTPFISFLVTAKVNNLNIHVRFANWH